ncbi:hypothetical protein E3A20_09720 [Planctomyces bekefii]|uniref:Uncharacterized protein n=2 Tax=Planctomyces bekefii TaxID=1653850 RepID=A0A5C6M723_9PLAN|nr:hypothetical protein E3A20_09720 [Planctomyces bekefii]
MTGYPQRPLQVFAAGTCNQCLLMCVLPDMNPSPAASTAERTAVLGRHALNLPNLITGTRLLLAFGLFAMIALTSQWIPAERLAPITQECNELIAILTSIVKKTRDQGRA